MPDRVKPSFVIFDIRALWRSECPDVKNYKWRLNPVCHRMLYMAAVGVKGINRRLRDVSLNLQSSRQLLRRRPWRDDEWTQTSATRDHAAAAAAGDDDDDVDDEVCERICALATPACSAVAMETRRRRRRQRRRADSRDQATSRRTDRLDKPTLSRTVITLQRHFTRETLMNRIQLVRYIYIYIYILPAVTVTIENRPRERERERDRQIRLQVMWR